MKKFVANNKIDWRNQLIVNLKNLSLKNATKYCIRRDYVEMYNDTENRRIEFVKFACGVADSMIVLNLTEKNRVKEVEYWEA